VYSLGKDDSCTTKIEKKREETTPPTKDYRNYPRGKNPRELANKTKQKTAENIITICLATSLCKPTHLKLHT